MKILHVWDQAGVSCLLTLYQRKLGHQADIIMREEYSAGILELYGVTGKMFWLREKIDTTTLFRRAYYHLPKRVQGIIRYLKKKTRAIMFYMKIWRAARYYDIIHIHSSWITVFLLPFKKKIVHWHGDDCRTEPCMTPRFKRFVAHLFIRIYSKNHRMYVSTPDLVAYVPNSTWLPNPVDLCLFAKRNISKPNTALYAHNWYEPSDHAKEIAEAHGWQLTILDRTRGRNWISHEKFPEYLASFEYFIDRKVIPSLSKTALEALFLGLKVVQGWDGKVIQGLDPKHYPDACARRVLRIYEEMLA